MATLVFEKYTYEDYKMWDGKWELIEGIPQAMAPSPVGEHQYILTRISYNLNKQLEELNCTKCFVLVETDYIVSDDTVLKPDVSLICGKIPKFIKTPPVAIFEVISPSTKIRDEITKKTIYNQTGVKNYFLVYPDEKKIIFKDKEIKTVKIDTPCGEIKFNTNDIFKGLN